MPTLNRRTDARRWLLAIVAAPMLLLPAITTATADESTTRVSRWPNGIERKLGSIAGSLAKYRPAADSKVPQPSKTPHETASLRSSPTVTHSDPTRLPDDALVPFSRNSIASVLAAAPDQGPLQFHLDAYRGRASQLPGDAPAEVSLPGSTEIVPSAEIAAETLSQWQPWWLESIQNPIGLANQPLQVQLHELLQTALMTSPHVQAVLTEPQLRQRDLMIADANFDPMTFIESRFADTSEPIGSTLTTGTTDERFRDETLTAAAGIRKRTRTGRSFELAQRGGFQENNSSFLLPNPQGTTRLELNFTQPLLKDQGSGVNMISVVLARIDVQIANAQVQTELQNHLISVARAYWDLYRSRAEYVQRRRLLQSAVSLRDVLSARGNVDSLQRQILRADVAVMQRRSDLVRARAKIADAQATLRMLTGDPRLIQNPQLELTPQEEPAMSNIDVSLRQATVTALENRADIATSLQRIHAISSRLGVSRNQLLPRLDLVLSGYVSGLESNSDTFGAATNQFSTGRPSYSAGVLFELPWGNRAATARVQRDRLELTRAMYRFRQTTESAFAEVEIAARETETSYAELIARKHAMDAAEREVDYLKQRWQLLPDPNESAVLLIENLLEAQERLADQQQAVVRAQVDYAMSWVALRETMGVLLRFDPSAAYTNQPVTIPSAKTDLQRRLPQPIHNARLPRKGPSS